MRMMNYDDFLRSDCFWSMGLRYIHLVRVSAEQVVAARNQTVATLSDCYVTEEEEAARIEHQREWSDTKLVEPLLYNFYHGIELLLKGFVLTGKEPRSKPDHKLTRLLESFVAVFPHETGLVDIFRSYLIPSRMPDLLTAFLKENESSVDRFFESLRYPFNRDLSKSYEHIVLKYKGREGVPFYEQLVSDTKAMTLYSVMLGKQLEEDCTYRGLSIP